MDPDSRDDLIIEPVGLRGEERQQVEHDARVFITGVAKADDVELTDEAIDRLVTMAADVIEHLSMYETMVLHAMLGMLVNEARQDIMAAAAATN